MGRGCPGDVVPAGRPGMSLVVGGEADADDLPVVSGEDVLVGEGRVRPADATAAPELDSGGFNQLGATDFLEAFWRRWELRALVTWRCS